MFCADAGVSYLTPLSFLASLLLQVLLEVPKLICQQPEPKSHDYLRTTALKEKSSSNVAFACVVLYFYKYDLSGMCLLLFVVTLLKNI